MKDEGRAVLREGDLAGIIFDAVSIFLRACRELDIRSVICDVT